MLMIEKIIINEQVSFLRWFGLIMMPTSTVILIDEIVN